MAFIQCFSDHPKRLSPADHVSVCITNQFVLTLLICCAFVLALFSGCHINLSDGFVSDDELSVGFAYANVPFAKRHFATRSRYRRHKIFDGVMNETLIEVEIKLG